MTASAPDLWRLRVRIPASPLNPRLTKNMIDGRELTGRELENWKSSKIVCARPADIAQASLLLVDCYGTAVLDEQLRPGITRFFREARANGKVIALHTDGHVDPRGQLPRCARRLYDLVDECFGAEYLFEPRHNSKCSIEYVDGVVHGTMQKIAPVVKDYAQMAGALGYGLEDCVVLGDIGSELESVRLTGVPWFHIQNGSRDIRELLRRGHEKLPWRLGIQCVSAMARADYTSAEQAR